jgi:RHS repeat-associated protein
VETGGGLHNPFGFTGYQADEISGLYFAQARWYGPGNARFVSEDFVRDGVNFYLHCYNNPLRFVDRNGLWGEDIHFGADNNLNGTVKWAKDIGISESLAISIGEFNIGTDRGSKGPMPWQDQSYHFNRNLWGIDSRQKHANDNLDKAIEIWNETQKVELEFSNFISELASQKQKALIKYRSGSLTIADYNKLMSEMNRLASEKYVEIAPIITGKRKASLQLLGEGLHALQDIEAHGNIGVGFPVAIHNPGDPPQADDIRYDWANENRRNADLVLSEAGARILETEKKTKEYLAKFMDGTGMEVKQCLEQP